MKRWLMLLLLLAMLPHAGFALDDDLPTDGRLPLYQETIPQKITSSPVKDMVIRINGMHRMATNYRQISMRRIEKQVRQFNSVLGKIKPHIPVYVYFVESSRSHPMTASFPAESKVYRYLKSNLKADAFDHLRFTTFAEYCRYFYSMDHHWNFRGSYQGYTDIVRMIKGSEEELIRPTGIHVTPVYYNGSFAKQTGHFTSEEPFALYRFNLYPAYTATAQGKKVVGDRISQYLSDRVNHTKNANHYGLCYGGDRGLTVLNGQKAGKGTLLLIGDSMSNAIRPLLIHHFDRIIAVDPRYYPEAENKPFVLSKTIKTYNVDCILIVSDTSLYLSSQTIQ